VILRSIPLIASENVPSFAVREVIVSDLGNSETVTWNRPKENKGSTGSHQIADYVTKYTLGGDAKRALEAANINKNESLIAPHPKPTSRYLVSNVNCT